MEISTEQLMTLLDKGTIVALFVITFVFVIVKGVPALVNLAREYLEKMEAEHTHRMKMMTEAFDKVMSESREAFLEMSTTFVKQIEKQHEEQSSYHETHRKELEAVRQDVQALGGKVEKALKSRK